MSDKGILGGKIANAVDIHQEALHLTLKPVVMFVFTMLITKASHNPLKESRPSLVFILWQAILSYLTVLKLKPLKALLLKGLGSDLVFSMTESFSLPCVRNRISITTG